MALNYYGFNSSVPSLFGGTRSANSFLIDGMNAEEYVRNNPGMSYNKFYDMLKDKLENEAQVVFSKKHIDFRALPIDGLMFFSQEGNLSDVKQVLGDKGFNSWKRLYDVIDKGSAATRTRVYGFDLETFGDITNPKASKNQFGITELAIGRRDYSGGKVAGKMATDKQFGSFAFGIDNEQRMFLQNIIDKFESSGWDVLTNEEKVSLSRLSRYRGSHESIFTTVMNPIFDNSNTSKLGYLKVNKLADEQLSLSAFKSGLKNLVRAGNRKDVFSREETIKKFLSWFTALDSGDKDIIYGANSEFDYSSLRAFIRTVGDDVLSPQDKLNFLKKLNAMQERTVDVIYAARTAAASQGKDVTSYMQGFNGIKGGAAVQEQAESLLFSFTQEHEGFLDVGNEGKLADFHTENIISLFTGNDEQERKKLLGKIYGVKSQNSTEDFKLGGVKEVSPEDISIFIRYGELDKTKGNEFAYRPSSKQGKWQVISNYGIKGEYYKLDMDHTGEYIVKNAEGQDVSQYVLTLISSGDVANAAQRGATDPTKEATRIVFKADSFEELKNISGRIARSSSMFIDSADGITDELVIAQQIAKYQDDGRRQFQKLLSPSDVRVVNENGRIVSYGGVRTLSDMYDVVHKLDKMGILPSDDSTPTEVSKYTTKLINAFHKQNRFGETKIPFISGDYQLKAFMSFSATLKNEEVLHDYIMEQVWNEFKPKKRGRPFSKPNFSVLSPEENMRATALYRKLYDEAISIMGQGDNVELKSIKLGAKTYSDKFKLSIAGLTDDTPFFVNTYSVGETANDFNRYLRTLDSSGNIGKFEKVLENLRVRTVIDEDTYRNALDTFNGLSHNNAQQREREIYNLANQVAYNVHSRVDKPGVMLLSDEYSIASKIASDRFKTYIVDGAEVSFADRFKAVQNQIESRSSEILGTFNSITYKNYQDFKHIGNLPEEILNHVNIKATPENKKIVKEIFNATEKDGQTFKSYSLQNYANEGVFSFVVSPDAEESSTFILHTNQAHRAKLQQLLESGKYENAFSSLSSLRNSEIGKHAAVEEIPYIKKYVVDAKGTELMSIKRGENFEQFLIQTMRTWKNDDGILQANYDTPDFDILSIHRQVGGTPIPYILNSDFDSASRVYVRKLDEYLKNAPSPADVSGVDRVMSFTSNDIMHAYEHRPVQGLKDIFREFVLVDEGGAAVGQRNHAQELVNQFGNVLGLSLKDDFDGDFNKYAKYVMNTSQWDEFFQRRLVNGRIIDEPWFMRNLDSGFQTQESWASRLSRITYDGGVLYNYNYNRSILEMMQDMTEAKHIARNHKKVINGEIRVNVLDMEQAERAKYTIDGNIIKKLSDSVDKVLHSFPQAELISMIGPESATEHGVFYYGEEVLNDGSIKYFSRTYGDSHNFSGMYSMMRPLYHQQGNAIGYDVNAIDNSVFENKFTQASFGTSSISSMEHEARVAINNGGKNLKKESEFIARVKVINDYTMQSTYDNMSRFDSNGIIKPDSEINIKTKNVFDRFNKKFGTVLSEDQYDAALQYMRDNLGSVYQDKVIASPLLMEQTVFNVNDSVKLETDFRTVDLTTTRKILERLKDQADKNGGDLVITRDTILGRRENPIARYATDIYWDKTDSIITSENLETLIKDLDARNPSSLIRLKTVHSDVFDRKLMLDGMEKGTIHTINTKDMARILNLGNDVATNEARTKWLAGVIFDELTDGAVIAMNPGIAKHGGLAGVESLWDVIVQGYTREDKVDLLKTQLNRFLKDHAEFHPRENDPARRELAETMQFFNSIEINGNKRIVGDVSRLERQSKFVEDFYKEFVLKGAADNSKSPYKALYQSIKQEQENLIDTNSFLATAHHQLMNTHMGTHMRVDRRIEQGWQLRGLNKGWTPDQTEAAFQWVEDFRRSAHDYTGVGTALKEEEFKKLEQAANIYSRSKNYHRGIYQRKIDQIGKGVTGLTRVLDYMQAPENFGVTQGNNVVHININELIGSGISHSSTGIDPGNLEASIFLKDGKPSKFLLDHANGKNIDDMFNIMIDFGEDVSYGGKTYNGILIPILTGNSFGDDKILYQNQPREIAALIGKIKHFSQTVDGGEQAFFSNILEYYTTTYQNNIAKETNIMKKDADLYKATRTYIAPNSGEFMGQDEATPFIRSQMDWKPKDGAETFGQLIEKRDSLAKKFARPRDQRYEQLISDYTKVNADINKYLKKMAEEAKEEFQKTGRMESITLNPKSPLSKIGGFAVGISEEGFERMGIDFGYIAEQLAADVEKHSSDGKYKYSGMENFVQNNDILKRLEELRIDSGFTDDIVEAGNGHVESLKNLISKMSIEDQDEFVEQFTKKMDIDYDVVNGIDELLPSFGNDRRLNYNDKASIITNVENYIDSYDNMVKELRKFYKKSGMSLPDELNGETLVNEFERDVYNVVRKKFKESGIAQDYMRQVGTYSEFIRFPVMRSQMLVKLILDDTVSGAQIRVNNPILSSLSHLDFDGDKVFLALLSNGMGILKATDERFMRAEKVYNAFLKNQAPELLEELIKESDSVSYQNPNAINMQKSELLAIINSNQHEIGIRNYLASVQNNDAIYKANFGDMSLDEATKLLIKTGKKSDTLSGIYQAAISSDEIANVFDSEITNVMFDDYAKVSSLVARIRKENIGHISTPAYKLRETLFETYLNHNEGLDKSQIDLIRNVITGLSNMDSESGGILSFAEQIVIDPKHARDSLLIQRADLFSTNVSKLLKSGFSGGLDDVSNTIATEARHKAILGMMEAIGTKVFDTDFSTQEGIDIAKYFVFKGKGTISNNDVTEISKAIANGDSSYKYSYRGKEFKLRQLEYLMTMRNLDEVVGGIEQVQNVYNNYVGAKDYREMVDYIQTITSFDKDQIRKMFTYTGSFDESVFDIVTADNAMVNSFQENGVYVASSIAKTNKGIEYAEAGRYVYHNGNFYDLVRDNDTNKFVLGSIASVDESKVFTPRTTVSIGDLNIRDAEAVKALSETRHLSVFSTALDYYFLDEDETVRGEVLKKFGRKKHGYSVENFLSKMKITDDQLSELEDFTLTLDYAKHIKGQSIDGADSGADLIRQLNLQIAENYRNNPKSIQNGTELIDFYRQGFIKAVAGGDEEFFGQLMRETEATGTQFDTQEYIKQLDLLRRKAYNVGEMYHEAEASFEYLKSFDNVADNKIFLDKAQKKAIEKQLNSREAKIGSMLDSAFARSSQELLGYEKTIYGLFDTPEAMETFFGWQQDNIGTMKVGFGNYFGVSFNKLSSTDKEMVLREAQYLLDKSVDAPDIMTDELKHAITATQTNLDKYEATATVNALDNIVSSSSFDSNLVSIKQANANIVAHAAKVNSEGIKTARKRLNEQMTQAQRIINSAQSGSMRAGTGGATRQTLHGSFLDSIQGLNITGKQVGMAVAAMAGIGLVNKLLHPSYQRSPLEAGKSGASQPPIDNNPNSGIAPATPDMQRTVYHDNVSGLNFKVNARTRGRIDDVSMQRSLNRAGVNNAQVYIHNDTTNVSNNWLSNKFAELAE